MNKTIIFGLLLAMLFLTSCSNTGKTNSGYNPFLGGDAGIKLEFITSAPPKEVYDNKLYPFSIGVQIENVGESDIKAGFVEVRGISADEFGVSSSSLKKKIPEIRGARKNSDGSVMSGLIDVVTFDGLSYQQDLAGDLPISNLRVRACYDYQTKASTQLCVKPSGVDGLQDNEICLVSENKDVSNSGAPLKIANVKESPKGNDGIMVSFDIVHVGNQNFKWFSKGDDNCDSSLDNPNLYKVEIEVGSISNGKYLASCARFNGADTGTIIMFNGASQRIVCEFKTGRQEYEFETPLNINLNYRYMQYVEKEILVKDLGSTNN